MAAVEVAVEAERGIEVEAGLEAPPGRGEMIVRIAEGEADITLDAYMTFAPGQTRFGQNGHMRGAYEVAIVELSCWALCSPALRKSIQRRPRCSPKSCGPTCTTSKGIVNTQRLTAGEQDGDVADYRGVGDARVNGQTRTFQ